MKFISFRTIEHWNYFETILVFFIRSLRSFIHIYFSSVKYNPTVEKKISYKKNICSLCDLFPLTLEWISRKMQKRKSGCARTVYIRSHASFASFCVSRQYPASIVGRTRQTVTRDTHHEVQRRDAAKTTYRQSLFGYQKH